MSNRVPAFLATLAVLVPLAGCPDDPAPAPPACTVDCDVTGELRLSNPTATACEVLLEVTGGNVGDVVLGSAVDGRWVSEGNRTGLALISDSTTPLPASPATVAFSGELKILRSHCYDASGRPLEGAVVTL